MKATMMLMLLSKMMTVLIGHDGDGDAYGV